MLDKEIIENWLGMSIADIDTGKTYNLTGLHLKEILSEFSTIRQQSSVKVDDGDNKLLAEMDNSVRSWEMEKQAMEWLSANHAKMPPGNSIKGWIQNRMDLIEARLKHGKQALRSSEMPNGSGKED